MNQDQWHVYIRVIIQWLSIKRVFLLQMSMARLAAVYKTHRRRYWFSGGGLLSSPILAPSGLCAHVRFISLDGARRNYKRNDGISWPHFRAEHRSGRVRRRRRRPLRRPAHSRSFPFAKMRIRRTSWRELHCV